MTTVEAATDVNVPVDEAYDIWTQFDRFPHFMEGIESVDQLSDDTFRFRGNLYGHIREWTARVVEQDRPTRLAWESIEGAENSGTLIFDPVTPRRTRVALTLEFTPETLAEKAGDALGLADARIRADLDRFREYAESGPLQRERRDARGEPPQGGEPAGVRVQRRI